MTGTPLTPTTRPRPRGALPAALASRVPAAERVIDPAERVIDLDSVRDTRRPATPNAGWACPECQLSAGPFQPAEAALLASVHDQVLRHSPRTALPKPHITDDDVIISNVVGG